MRRAPTTGHPNSRALAVGCLISGLVALGADQPAAAQAPGGSPAYGGSRSGAAPVITGMRCVSRCGASSASRGPRGVSVRPDGVVKVRGRNLSGVRAVVFTGGSSRRDDVRARPSGVGRLSVDVVIPGQAPSGRVVLVTDSVTTAPSPQSLTVTNRGDDEDDDDDGDRGDDGGGNGDKPSPGRLAWPVPRAPIFGVFGESRPGHVHSGVDITAPIGTPVRAAAAGKVIFSGVNGAYGNLVCLAHSSISTCYAHLQDLPVKVGESISGGGTIGHVGMTGNSSGPHLHFEVRQGTAMYATPVDPMAYLPGAPVATGKASAAALRGPLDWGLPVYGPGHSR